MEEDILNYLYQLSCFVGHPVLPLLLSIILLFSINFLDSPCSFIQLFS